MRLKNKFWSCRIASVAVAMLAMVTAVSADVLDAPLPQEVTIRGVEFILIPAGWFYKTGGTPETGLELEYMREASDGNIKLWLDDYYMAKFEARARDLSAFLNAKASKFEASYGGRTTGCSVRQNDEGTYFELHPELDAPATHLSWRLADDFARWMGFRLASEAEWEKAARGDDQRLYPWGNDYPDETYAAYDEPGACGALPVNSFEKGRSPYGLYNMAGNVREFVADWYNMEYDANLKDGMQAPPVPEQGSVRADQGPWKLLKGGRWGSTENGIRIDIRVFYSPNTPFRCNGTRFAIDAAAVRQHVSAGSAIVTRP